MFDTLKNWIAPTKAVNDDIPLPQGYDLCGYQIDRVIHRGGMSWVYKAWDPKGKTVIIKEFFPHNSAKRDGFNVAIKVERALFFREAYRRFHEEGRFMGLFRGANFSKIRTFFRHNDTAYIVLEQERGRTLGAYIKVPRKRGAKWRQIKPYANDIRLALLKLHQANVLHLDVHPANIMLSLGGRGILLDMGAARHAAEPVINSARFYTPGYSAPEIQTDTIWGPWTDIYSFGCCLKALGALDPEHDFPTEVRAFVRACLIENPKERIRRLDDPRALAIFDN